jgi:Zn finger protein HypA/HybF involved in hydrogenase expression
MSWNKGMKVYSDEEVFCQNSNASQSLLRKYYLEKVEYKCSCCDILEWNGKSIKLEIDHIDGNRRNNTLENLRLLCPNCHSQTETYKSKNITGKRKVSDAELSDALFESDYISQALIKVGLAPRGGNYARAKRIIEEKEIAMRVKKLHYCHCGKRIDRSAKECQECSFISKRKVDRPNKEELQKMIKEMSWIAIGKQYGVSDNAVRKWARKYNLI